MNGYDIWLERCYSTRDRDEIGGSEYNMVRDISISYKMDEGWYEDSKWCGYWL